LNALTCINNIAADPLTTNSWKSNLANDSL